MKSQIALEFLIVISLVIIIFLFLFFIISSQRTNSLSSQSFSQLQLVSQSISSQIYKAYTSSGSYSAQIPLYGPANARSYNVTITKGGIVILQQMVGSQHIQAISYSGVPILSNSSYLIPGSSTSYLIPVTNGTISIMNSFGTICIDLLCPTSSNTPASLVLTSQNSYAAQFNGATSEITSPTNNFPTGSASRSVFMWIYYPGTICTSYYLCTLESYGGADPVSISVANSTTYGRQAFLYFNGNGNSNDFQCTNCKIPSGKWTFVGYTYNSISGVVTIYVNGQPNSASVGALSTPSASTSSIGAGGLWGAFTGSISNVQVYSTLLSNNQVLSLYNGGITSSPILPANIVGWWPLNGNANDYSGNGNLGTISGYIPFPSVSQIFAKVSNSANQPANDVLVGFTASSGNFSVCECGATSNYTNANGIATAFLSPNNYITSYATVKAAVYDGNSTSQGTLYEWLPANLGQGNVIYDNGPLNQEGYSSNGVYWNSPNYAASFDGHSSIISLPASVLNPASALTVSVWFRTTRDGVVLWNGNTQPPSPAAGYSPIIYVNTNGDIAGGDWTGAQPFSTSLYVANGGWHMATLAQTSSLQTLYVDGVEVATSTGGPQSFTPFYWSIGEGWTTGWSHASSGNFYFNGQIANVQFYSSTLTSQQVLQLYQNGINSAPSNTLNLIAWYPLDGDANDYSGNGYNASIHGNMQFTNNFTRSSVTNQSSVLYANFNGQSSDVIVHTASPLLLTSSATLAVWVKWRSGVHNSGICCFPRQEILGADSSPNTEINPIIAVNNSGAEEVESWVCTSGGCWTEAQTPYHIINTGKWYFLVSRYNGSDLSIWVNGVQEGSAPVTGQLQLQGTGDYAYIGSLGAGGSWFNGSVADAQIYNTSLSSSQIQNLYQQGASSVPLQNSSLVAWWPLNGNANDFSVHGIDGVPTNIVYQNGASYPNSWTTSLGNYGINLNGVNGYVNLPYAALSSLKSYTVAGWFNFRSFANGPALYSYDNNGEKLYVDANGIVISDIYGSSDSSTYSTTALNPNTWYFITQTVSYNSISGVTAHSIWVNGENQSTATFTGSVATGSSGSSVGSLWKQYEFLNGSVADFQIYDNALNAQQIQQLYDSGMPKTYSISVPTGWLP